MENTKNFMDLDDNDVVQIEKEIITSYIKNNIDFLSNEKAKDSTLKSNRIVSLLTNQESKTIGNRTGGNRTMTRIDDISKNGTLKDFKFGEDLILGKINKL
jgi:hypothetical protein